MSQPPTSPHAGPGGPAAAGNRQQVYYLQRREPSYTVTWVLLGLCIAVFLGQLVVPGVTDALGLDSRLTPTQPWRVITSAFIHLGFLHLAMNMLALVMLGRPLETVLGQVRYLVLYVVSALGGSALSLIYWAVSGEQGPILAGGASGAIFGLFGALVVMQAYGIVRAGNLLPVLGINLALSFVLPGIAWQAHIGGLLVGAAITWAMVRTLRGDTSRSLGRIEVGLITAIVIGVIVASLVMLRG